MHQVLFSLKRADQCSRALQRRLLGPFDITHARYDLLFIVFNRRHRDWRDTYQSHLRRLLGVTAPTVCKMLKSLEALGFVTRRRSEFDRRQVYVVVTKKAKHLLRRVRKKVIKPAILWLALYMALSRTAKDMRRLKALADVFRKGLGDPATYDFPWQDERKKRSWDPIEPYAGPTYQYILDFQTHTLTPA